MKPSYLRIIDANLNRSREGLRVCEDIARFVISDRRITKAFKLLRHKLTKLSEKLSISCHPIYARDSRADVGKETLENEGVRKGILDVFSANIKRVEESFRVLEEVTKLTDAKLADEFKKIRFKLYDIEKRAVIKFKNLRDSG